MLPGVAPIAKHAYVLELTSSDANVFVAAELGIALGVPAFYEVYIRSGVVLSTTSTALPALNINVGADSHTLLVNEGTIEGKGGDAGSGFAGTWGLDDRCSGGGGGGAGTAGGTGAGGDAGYPSTIGADGTSGAGGAAGSAEFAATLGSIPPRASGTDGADGGRAIYHANGTLSVVNDNGNIWGGGGGGGGGGHAGAAPLDPRGGGAGGASGQAGSDGVGPNVFGAGGAGGNAIKHAAAATVTFVSGGSSPNLEGAVST